MFLAGKKETETGCRNVVVCINFSGGNVSLYVLKPNESHLYINFYVVYGGYGVESCAKSNRKEHQTMGGG